MSSNMMELLNTVKGLNQTQAMAVVALTAAGNSNVATLMSTAQAQHEEHDLRVDQCTPQQQQQN
jgi:hypothetical protein